MKLQSHDKKYRILVVDDNPAIHDDFRKILTSAKPAERELAAAEVVLFGAAAPSAPEISFEIDSAFQGMEGVKLAQQAIALGRRYALAFVDVRMPPGWDGIETSTRLWQEDPDLQIVICTAYADYSWAEINQELGRSDSLVILKKPFDNIEVLQLVHALTKKWSLTQEAKSRLSGLEVMVQARTKELEIANGQLRLEIRERVQTEEALRLSEERFSKAFMASPIPLAIVTLEEDRYVDVNDSFLHMTGYRRGEVIDRTSAELGLVPDLEARAQIFQRLREEKAVRNLEWPIRTKSAEVRQTLVSLELVLLRERPHVLILTQDLTERLHLETQLRQSQKLEAVGKLAAGIAHDFNNLLTIIQGYSSLGLGSPNLDPDVRTSLGEILSAAKRAATLVRQLLAFSRKQLMHPEVLNLNTLIGRLQERLDQLAGRRIRVMAECALNLPPVHADSSHLEEVILELAANACDAMLGGGQLTISTALVEIDSADVNRNSEAVTGRYVCLVVSDTGRGMDATLQARVFEPFFTTKEVGRGTGMGLATVYGIVKQHEGWIELSSQVGRGTIFRVFLPAYTPEGGS